MPFVPEKMRGMTPTADLVDAKTGEVVIKAGEKITARKARELAEGGLKEVLVSLRRPRRPATSPRTSSTWRRVRSIAEAGDELDAELLAELKDQKVKEFPILDIDHVNVGPFIRNTLNIDKNANMRRGADGRLPGHASGRAADDRGGDQPVPLAVLRSASATTSRPSAA